MCRQHHLPCPCYIVMLYLCEKIGIQVLRGRNLSHVLSLTSHKHTYTSCLSDPTGSAFSRPGCARITAVAEFLSRRHAVVRRRAGPSSLFPDRRCVNFSSTTSPLPKRSFSAVTNMPVFVLRQDHRNINLSVPLKLTKFTLKS